MATSGIITLLAPGSDIVKEALEHLGVLAEGEEPNQDQLISCKRTLNYMVKSWQGRAPGLWTIQRLYIYLEKNKNEYSLGQQLGDHFTSENPIDNTSTLDGNEAALSTVIDVVSASGAASNDRIMIELDSGSSHWTTISSVSSNAITIASGIPTAAASGNRVYWYTSKGQRPFALSHGQRVTEPSNGTEVPIQIYTRVEYAELPRKTEDGTVLGVYYDPQITTGKLFVWPETNNVTDYLKLYVQRSIEDFNADDDDSDFTQEWFSALSFGLAIHLAPKYGISSESFNQLRALFAETMFDAESSDRESTVWFEPEYQSMKGR